MVRVSAARSARIPIGPTECRREEDVPPKHVAVGDVSADRAVAVLGVGLVQPSSIWEPKSLTGEAVCLGGR